jgi:hypothetical protein
MINRTLAALVVCWSCGGDELSDAEYIKYLHTNSNNISYTRELMFVEDKTTEKRYLNWQIDSNKFYRFEFSTNFTTNWMTIAKSAELHKQIGQTQTNRIILVSNNIGTNYIILDILGVEEWPSSSRYIKEQSTNK